VKVRGEEKRQKLPGNGLSVKGEKRRVLRKRKKAPASERDTFSRKWKG